MITRFYRSLAFTQGMGIGSKREPWIDWIRAGGAFAIIVLHVTVREKVRRSDHIGATEWWTLATYEAITRIAVPLFLMISGYLVLLRFASGAQYSYSLSKAKTLAVIALFWTVVFSVWEFCKGYDATPWGFLANTLLGKPYYHLWFLFAIAGCYLVAPVIASGLRLLTPKHIPLFGCLIPLAFSLDATLNAFSPSGSSFRSSIVALPIPYVSLALSAYFLTTRPSRLTFFLGLLGYVSGLFASLTAYGLLSHYQFTNADTISFNPLSPPVVVMSLGAFVAIFQLSREVPFPRHAFTEALARDSMGIYLLHPFFLDFLNHLGFLGREPIALIGIPLLSIAVLAGTWVAVALLKRIPLIRRSISL